MKTFCLLVALLGQNCLWDMSVPTGYSFEYTVTKWIPPDPVIRHLSDYRAPKHFPRRQIQINEEMSEEIDNAADYITTYPVPKPELNLPTWQFCNLCELFLAADRALSREGYSDHFGTNECGLIQLLWHNSPAILARTKPFVPHRDYIRSLHKYIEHGKYYVTWHRLAQEIKRLFGTHLESARHCQGTTAWFKPWLYHSKVQCSK